MPKRVGFLYERMLDRDFIRSCIYKGAENKDKSRRRDVVEVLDNVEFYVNEMYRIIEECDYTPSPPVHRKRYDPSSQKWRIIGVQPFFPDGIIQQMIVRAMQDVIMRGMHYWNCGSIPERGGAHALKYARRVIQKHRKNTKYVAELDVKQFYPSTPQLGVIHALERKIKDKKFLLLIAVTISCYEKGMSEAMSEGLSAEDIVKDKIGLEIGFYINQWLENYYLETVDRLALACEGVKFEYRYMDNINLAGRNKKKLHKAIRAINKHLKNDLGLTLKENWQLFPVKKRALSSVGYRIFVDRVILRKRNFLRLIRQARRVKKKIDNHKPIPLKMAQGLLSRIGLLKHCNCHNVLERYIYPIGIKRLKDVVRAHSKAVIIERRFIYGN